jgi:hypothetical protein
VLEGHEGTIGREVVGLGIVDLIQRPRTGCLACCHQVAGDFGLAVDHDVLPAGQALEINVHAATIEDQFKAIVGQAFGVHALANPGLAQQLHHALFEHAGADAAEDVVGRLPFQDHSVDPSVVQQLAEQQPRGAGADNGDLSLEGFHCCYDSQEARDQGRRLFLVILACIFRLRTCQLKGKTALKPVLSANRCDYRP